MPSISTESADARRGTRVKRSVKANCFIYVCWYGRCKPSAIKGHFRLSFEVFHFEGYPEPEGGADAFVARDANLSATLIDDGLTDGQSEACALDEVVELDETLEHGILLVFWNARSRVLAIEIPYQRHQ